MSKNKHEIPDFETDNLNSNEVDKASSYRTVTRSHLAAYQQEEEQKLSLNESQNMNQAEGNGPEGRQEAVDALSRHSSDRQNPLENNNSRARVAPAGNKVQSQSTAAQGHIHATNFS